MARITADVVAAVIAAGMKPYMRKAATDTRLVYAEGDNIANLQAGPFGYGFTRSTIHKANNTTGTGFRLDDDFHAVEPARLTHDFLAEAFTHAPSWANNRDRESVRKFKGMDEYTNDWFNKEYREVEVRYARAMVRQRGAIGSFGERVFACVVPVTGSHSETMDALTASINAQHFEVERILDHSMKRDCV